MLKKIGSVIFGGNELIVKNFLCDMNDTGIQYIVVWNGSCFQSVLSLGVTKDVMRLSFYLFTGNCNYLCLYYGGGLDDQFYCWVNGTWNLYTSSQQYYDVTYFGDYIVFNVLWPQQPSIFHIPTQTFIYMNDTISIINDNVFSVISASNYFPSYITSQSISNNFY